MTESNDKNKAPIASRPDTGVSYSVDRSFNTIICRAEGKIPIVINSITQKDGIYSISLHKLNKTDIEDRAKLIFESLFNLKDEETLALYKKIETSKELKAYKKPKGNGTYEGLQRDGTFTNIIYIIYALNMISALRDTKLREAMINRGQDNLYNMIINIRKHFNEINLEQYEINPNINILTKDDLRDFIEMIENKNGEFIKDKNALLKQCNKIKTIINDSTKNKSKPINNTSGITLQTLYDFAGKLCDALIYTFGDENLKRVIEQLRELQNDALPKR